MKRKILITLPRDRLKRFFVVGFLLVVLGVLYPRPVYADCWWWDPQSFFDCPDYSQVTCYIQGEKYCCATEDECISEGGSLPTPTPPAGGAVGNVPCPGGVCQTALGPISADPAEFVQKILSWAIGIGGGIAFLLMLFGGFTIMTSTGNPEKINQGKSIITSAVTGLLFIIFSVVLLQIIGYDILGLGKLGLKGD